MSAGRSSRGGEASVPMTAAAGTAIIGLEDFVIASCPAFKVMRRLQLSRGWSGSDMSLKTGVTLKRAPLAFAVMSACVNSLYATVQIGRVIFCRSFLALLSNALW